MGIVEDIKKAAQKVAEKVKEGLRELDDVIDGVINGGSEDPVPIPVRNDEDRQNENHYSPVAPLSDLTLFEERR